MTMIETNNSPKTTTVTLLLGGRKETFEDVPVTATRQELRDRAIRGGKGTMEEWHESYPELTPASDKAKLLAGDAVDFAKDQTTMLGGLGGAAGGAAVGSLAGPVGTVVGGIVGGAVGTGGGSLLQDSFEGNDLRYATAAREAGLSIGFDIATLGVGKIGKIVVPAIKAAMKKGQSPKQAAELIIGQARAGEGSAGSIESLQASQKFLSEAGATLSPAQTGRASGMQLFGEKLANTGIFSQRSFEKNAESVNVAVNNAFSEIMGNTDKIKDYAADSVGEVLYGVIEAGTSKLSQNYGASLKIIDTAINKTRVSVDPLRQTLETFKKNNKKEFVDQLHKDTTKLVNEYVSLLSTKETANASTLIAIQQKITNDINDLRNAADKKPAAIRQLTILSEDVKKSIQKTLDGVDPKAGEAYRKLNADYAKGLSDLTPKITENMLMAADKGKFEAIGVALMSKSTNLGATKALLKSVDESFKLLGDGVETFAFKNAGEVKEVIRAGYIKKLFSEVGTDSFDIVAHKNAHDMFNDPNSAKKLALVLGDKFKSVKQLTNVMSEAAVSPTSNIGELALRSREFAVGGASIAGIFAGNFSIESMGAAALVFGTPYFLSKAALNAKSVNKILAFEKRDFKGDVVAKKLMVTNIIADVLKDMTSDEQQELMDSMQVR